MIFKVLTLFPELFQSFFDWSIIGRARARKILELEAVNIRDFSLNKHHKVDDYPYGGGLGMVMSAEPIVRCLESVNTDNARVIYLSPQGKIFNQTEALKLSKEERLVLLCGHYEGVDERVIENYVDEELSIGDFVMTGGEVAAMAVIEATARLLPGVLKSEKSYAEESFSDGLLEYPQYTRPETFRGSKVPEVLLNGNHKEIEKWRHNMSLENTRKKRGDLWLRYETEHTKRD